MSHFNQSFILQDEIVFYVFCILRDFQDILMRHWYTAVREESSIGCKLPVTSTRKLGIDTSVFKTTNTIIVDASYNQFLGEARWTGRQWHFMITPDAKQQLVQVTTNCHLTIVRAVLINSTAAKHIVSLFKDFWIIPDGTVMNELTNLRHRAGQYAPEKAVRLPKTEAFYSHVVPPQPADKWRARSI